jgi:hypothetical protein
MPLDAKKNKKGKALVERDTVSISFYVIWLYIWKRTW